MKRRVRQFVLLGLSGALLGGCATGGKTTIGADTGPGVAQQDVDAMKSQMDQVALDLAAMAAEQEELSGEGSDRRNDLPSLSLEELAGETGAERGGAGGVPEAANNRPRDGEERSKPTLLGSAGSGFEVDPELAGHEPLGGRLALLDVPPALIWSENEAPEIAETASERADRLAREFGEALDEGAMDGASAYRAALAKAGLGSHAGERPLPPPNLSIASQPLFEALTDLHETLATHAEDPVAHMDDAVEAADAFARRISELASLKIARIELCSSVDGFGQFTPLRSNKFLAGRTTPVILYVEVDHFGYREVDREWGSEDEAETMWRVELSQELQLYRANETTPVWSKPAQSVTDVSLNRRRDFHIVHQVNIPASLKLGIYRLKVRMSDSVTGQIAEEVTSIQVVTDERLLK